MLENTISNIYFCGNSKNARISKNFQNELREILELLQGFKFNEGDE